MRITDLLRRSDGSSDGTLSTSMYRRLRKRLRPCYAVDYHLGEDRDQDGMIRHDGERIPFKEHPDFAAIKRCEAYCEAHGIEAEPIVISAVIVQPPEPPEVQERRPGDPIPVGLSRVVEDGPAEDTPERAETPERDVTASEPEEPEEAPAEPTEPPDAFVIDGVRYESMDDYGAHQDGEGVVEGGRWFPTRGAANAWVRETAYVDGPHAAALGRVLRATRGLRTFN